MFIATLSLNSLECNFVTTFNCFHPETGETESVAKARGRNLDVIWKGKFFYSVGDKERFGWEEIPAGIDIYDTREGLYHAYKLVRFNSKGEAIYKSKTRNVAIKVRG